MDIAHRLESIKSTLPAQCRLIAVSKTHPVETIQEAYMAGQRLFGENKVQEMVPKSEALPKDIEWHMIGHLQRNKVKYIAPFVTLIHSVDSMSLLEEINKQAEKVGRVIPCLLQIHIAMEETKFGFSEEEVMRFLRDGAITALSHVKVYGLMGMATLTDNQAQIRSEFGGLKKLFDSIRQAGYPGTDMRELSMGMSSDYTIAIEQGSTLIRVGSSIFGSRNYSTK